MVHDRNCRRWLTTSMLCLALSGGVESNDFESKNFEWSGFVSQGLIYSPDNPIFGIDSDWSAEFFGAGVGGQYTFSPKFRVAGQVLSRLSGELENGDPELNYLFVDYAAIQNPEHTVGLRLGRVKNPWGLYNSTRNIPHANPGVFVSSAVYFETFRESLSSVDGVGVYSDSNFPLGRVQSEIQLGEGRIYSDGIEYQLFGRAISGEFNHADLAVFKLGFEPNYDPRLHVSFSYLDIALELENGAMLTPEQLPAAFADVFVNPANSLNYVESLDIDTEMSLLSIQYSLPSWVFTGEYLRIKSDLTNLSILTVPAPDAKGDSEGYYVQAEWLPNEHLSVYTRFDRLYFNKDDKRGEQFALESGANGDTQFFESQTIGARWYFTPDMSVTFEYSVNEGVASLLGPDNIDYSNLSTDWDLFVTQFAFHF